MHHDILTIGYHDEMSIGGLQPSAMDMLGKPYRQSELIDRMQSALRRGVQAHPG